MPNLLPIVLAGACSHHHPRLVQEAHVTKHVGLRRKEEGEALPQTHAVAGGEAGRDRKGFSAAMPEDGDHLISKQQA